MRSAKRRLTISSGLKIPNCTFFTCLSGADESLQKLAMLHMAPGAGHLRPSSVCLVGRVGPKAPRESWARGVDSSPLPHHNRLRFFQYNSLALTRALPITLTQSEGRESPLPMSLTEVLTLQDAQPPRGRFFYTLPRSTSGDALGRRFRLIWSGAELTKLRVTSYSPAYHASTCKYKNGDCSGPVCSASICRACICKAKDARLVGE